MKCDFEKLSAYFDGLLPETERALLEKHLKTCEACTSKLEELVRLEVAVKKIPAPKLSEAYWENFAGRVQNKITIRDKQKMMPHWLENLKSFFQPTTGKLTLAGSLATILLVAILGQDYWKKEAYQPPVFDGQEIRGIAGLNDSLKKADLPGENERQMDADKRTFAVSGRRDEPVPEKQARENKQKGVLAPPASAVASKPVEEGIFRSALKDEKANEADLAVEGRISTKENTPLATGEKAQVRQEVDTLTNDISKLPIRSVSDLLKLKVGVTSKGAFIFHRSTVASSETSDTISANDQPPAREDTVVVTAGEKAEIRKEVATSQDRVAAAEPKALSSFAMPSIDTAKAIADLKRVIAEKEKQLTAELFKETAESLYVFLGNYYMDLYRFSLQTEDFEKANLRLNEFSQKDVSEVTRQRLTAIQAELKKIKK